jgi:succinate dehydrogenase/fumarate reductase cytochrome b subunit
MTESMSPPARPSRLVFELVPAAGIIAYPWLLKAFHWGVVAEHGGFAAAMLALAFAVPLICFLFASRSAAVGGRTVHQVRMRRLAYLGVIAPTLFVFLGVVHGLLHSPVPDDVAWFLGWTTIAIWASAGSTDRFHLQAESMPARWRVVHGISGAVILAYVLFHIGNHLFGLGGPAVHTAVMKAGRAIYRNPLIEPVLVTLFILQVITGLRLAWRWSALPADWHRVFQVASGFYLSAFILGHMNSVFIYARTVQRIDTGWNFATGAPSGLIYDAWNIRLLPHYALGVFFVLAHLASGLRVVLLAHGLDRRWVDGTWSVAVVGSIAISAAIIAGMCGVRI